MKGAQLVQLRTAVVIVILSLSSACSSVSCRQPPEVPRGSAELHGKGQVYFVPIGSFSPEVVQELVAYYEKKQGLRISVLTAPPDQIVAQAFNEKRGQYVAEEITRILGQAVVAFEPDSALIALMENDLYIREYDRAYAFDYRSGGRVVVSSARMSEKPGNDELQKMRLRKMVTKYIGVLHYRLPMSSNCRSPLFNQIGGPQELDFMEEEL